MTDETQTEWLLAGDPAIRWQVMRDLLDEPADVWERERCRTVDDGWVAELLRLQGTNGEWPKGRWTDSTWTLLLLVALGLPEEHAAARRPIEHLLGRFMPEDEEVDQAFLLKRVDLCHLAFWLGLASYFLPADPRLPGLGAAVLSAQLADGGWNCRARNHPETHHGSFHTTLNVLENMRVAAERGAVSATAFGTAELSAAEFLVAHRLYRSDHTGEVISTRFIELSYPWHWHYTVLRGLDYLRLTPAIDDRRLDDPIDVVVAKRKPSGRWPLEKRIPGTLLVEMEKPGQESRWNTLRALRVLKARSARRSRTV
jgi:hypothetical protein